MPESGEVGMDTSPVVTPETDPSRPAEGTTIPGGVQITPQKKGDEQPKAKAEPKVERPAWLPEKYKTPEEFAKAHAELEKKIGQPKPKTEVKPPVEGETQEIDMAALAAEYAEKGQLSDESIADLTKRGLPPSVVQRFAEGQKALAERQTAVLADAVGGAESLKEILEWSGKNLTKPEIDGYNTLIDSGNLEAAKLMLGTFQGKFVEANGSDPKTRVNGDNAPTLGDEPAFKSANEMVKAMSDKRYKEGDPAYVAQVQRRVAKSKAF